MKDKLVFRRQFLFSSKPTDKLKHWQFLAVGDHFLYVHPDCALTSFDHGAEKLILIGYVLDPHQEHKNNLEILKGFALCNTVEGISEKLFPLVGRFVLMVQNKQNFTIFNDACGLKTVYYTREGNSFYAASQPLLLKLVLPIEAEVAYEEYINSDYVKNNREHWLPCGVTLFKNVEQLVPNHYLEIASNKQIRYWPNRKVSQFKPEEAIGILAPLLRSTIMAARKRFDLALAMTAGHDSRIVLSASKAIAEDLFFYTLKYRNLSNKSADINISKILIEGLGYEHHVLDCKEGADEAFLRIYKENTSISHLNDWGTIAFGIYKNYPESKMAIRGNCVEIGRYYYLPNKKIWQTTFVDKISVWKEEWKKFGFVKMYLDKWHEEMKQVTALGYNLRDIFYWEHRMGGWQAQSQLEWDMVQEMFTPFNNREVIELMLGVDEQYRSKKVNVSFFTDLIQSLWPELLDTPINPKSNKQKIKSQLKSILTTLGLFRILEKIHN